MDAFLGMDPMGRTAKDLLSLEPCQRGLTFHRLPIVKPYRPAKKLSDVNVVMVGSCFDCNGRAVPALPVLA